MADEDINTAEAQGTTGITSAGDQREAGTALVVAPQTLPTAVAQAKAQQALDNAAKGGQVNPFTAVALVLQAMRTDLESPKEPGRLPRWMRIVRVRRYRDESVQTNFIATKGVIPITAKFVDVIGYLSELTLQAQDLLTQADGGKALLEVGGAMIKTIADDPFASAIKGSLGGGGGGENPLKPIIPVVDKALEIIDKIPDPEDVDIIANEIYRLLVVAQNPLPRQDDGTVDETKVKEANGVHIDMNLTGKVRLISWGLETPISFLGFKAGVKSTYLGSRWIWQTATPPQNTNLFYDPEGINEPIYQIGFTSRPDGTDTTGADITEAIAMLEKHGYGEPPITDPKQFTDNLARRLRRFQKLNGLDVNGELDNATTNRLCNLDVTTELLKRAKRYEAEALTDFDDTKNEPAA